MVKQNHRLAAAEFCRIVHSGRAAAVTDMARTQLGDTVHSCSLLRERARIDSMTRIEAFKTMVQRHRRAPVDVWKRKRQRENKGNARHCRVPRSR